MKLDEGQTIVAAETEGEVSLGMDGGWATRCVELFHAVGESTMGPVLVKVQWVRLRIAAGVIPSRGGVEGKPGAHALKK